MSVLFIRTIFRMKKIKTMRIPFSTWNCCIGYRVSSILISPFAVKYAICSTGYISRMVMAMHFTPQPNETISSALQQIYKSG